MKIMTRKSTLNEDTLQREWLVDKVYNPKKARSLDLATKSIGKLLERNQKVTIQAIHDISKVIDSDGEGIHRNTITSNEDVYAVYTANRNYHKPRQINRRAYKFSADSYPHFLKHIKCDRELTAVRSRYKRLTKQDLIDRLIQCEQYVAETKQQWVIAQFQSEMD
jgi:hypothetical protein